MRKIMLFIVLAAAGLAACKKKNKDKDCPSDSYTYSFKNNAQVDTGYNSNQLLYANVGTGNKRVFKYTKSHWDCPGLQDGGDDIVLLFEADPAVSHFAYGSDKLADARCYYRYIGYGVFPTALAGSGTIEGTRINDNTWRVSLDLATYGQQRITATANFVLEP